MSIYLLSVVTLSYLQGRPQEGQVGAIALPPDSIVMSIIIFQISMLFLKNIEHKERMVCPLLKNSRGCPWRLRPRLNAVIQKHLGRK